MKTAHYQAHIPDERGFVKYNETENKTWQQLYDRQMVLIENRACDEYLYGLEQLNLPADQIPQLPDVNRVLKKATGWEVEAVAAVIPFEEFFSLLANKKFPAATFIRTPQDIDYLQEPDIFHEIFGHCPLLTNPVFADFSEQYGKLGIKASKKERIYLARIFWFTVEFGLIETTKGLRIYGAGILSSKGESEYALESHIPERRPFDPSIILRTPYRIDIFQTIYYVIQNFQDIFSVMNETIMPLIHEAMQLGNFAPTYPLKNTATVTAPISVPVGVDTGSENKSHPC